jgi:ubiquinone biosynthesis accessory factor UbiJ
MPSENDVLPMTAQDPRWPPPLLRLIETALNRLLSLDSNANESLAALEGRSVALRLKPWPTPMQLSVVDGRLRAGDAQAADLAITATPGALLALAAERGGFELPAGRIDISGDADLARRVQKLIAQLDPDWDRPFAQFFGEVAGFQIAKGLRGALSWGRATAKAMLLNSTEYLREESKDLIAPGELADFVEGVERTRDDVERLEARIDRLARVKRAAAS